MAEQGATVVAAARRAEHLAALVQRVRDSGGKAEAVPADMAVGEQIQQLVQTVQQTHGRIDILMQVEDIAEAIVYAVTRPARVNVNEILITPTEYTR